MRWGIVFPMNGLQPVSRVPDKSVFHCGIVTSKTGRFDDRTADGCMRCRSPK